MQNYQDVYGDKWQEINKCFACGRNNPIGLKLDIKHKDDICYTTFTPKTEHSGWLNVMHGGLLSTIMDEVMAHWLWGRGIPAMTVEMTTRYLKPVPIGEPIVVTARLQLDRGRMATLEADVTLADGTQVARAVAKYIKTERGLQIESGRSVTDTEAEPEE
ncbi:thioesterase superfamily protein [Desulfotomaculum nigrificans CO-1-SRB]|uniref:Acyl-coenzyme A thioesterase THEM4 n=1 Tax=Desulfotomaculum nigrificans (strain DSM 14880 / VKM B-2319 / CO-1-SRB) TaxID=868595 RepID=F6B4V9_DESCC|nr:PaaI family thioesterase [Desulfotomaculum nigrificans]AEF95331.1 thioesterase superfamily protein [Desulfotomaculum nigrificans CO-1-SRB]